MNDPIPTPASHWFDDLRGASAGGTSSQRRAASRLNLVSRVTHVAQRWAEALEAADGLAHVLAHRDGLEPAEVRELIDQHILNHVAGLPGYGPELRAMVSSRLDGLLTAIDDLASEEVSQA